MRPLEDIRVVAIEQYGAGPFGTLHLADLGAEVIKVEDPHSGGDIGRYIPPFQEDEDSLFFETFNRNKRSISLDLRTAAGRSVFEDLVARSDAVVSNLRGDLPAKLRIRYADLAHINPEIVCLSLSGFGMEGPRSADPGYDYILQALTGWMSLTGEPDSPPAKSGLSLVDFSGGYVAAIGLLSGIHAARRDGRGMDCDISLYDVAMSLLTYSATWHMTRDWEPKRMSRSAHPSLVPFQLFRGSDDWFVLGCAKEKFFKRVVDEIGRPDLADHPHFENFQARNQHRDAIVSILDEVFATRTAAEWVDTFRACGVPVAPVRGVSEAIKDEHTIARDLIVETEHPRFGTVRSMASPVRVNTDFESMEHRRAPLRNEDAADLLANLLGYSAEQIASLSAAHAFGPSD